VGVRCGVCGGKCHGKVDRCGGAGESLRVRRELLVRRLRRCRPRPWGGLRGDVMVRDQSG
jgi:hypothetical protein